MTGTPKPLVLWIEDKFEAEMRDVREYLEETEKYDFRYASDVASARELIARQGAAARLVVLDVILPLGTDTLADKDQVMNAGICLYRESIRQLGVPVIVLSCRDDESAVEAFRGEPVIWLNKPVFPDELEARLDRALN